jgi:hypothetical protein
MSLESNTAGIQVNALVTPQKPIAYSCVVTGANTSYTDTPANSVELVPAQTKGARLTKVTVLMRATNTATELQLFTSTDSGTTKKFVDSALLAAYTVAQTTRQVKGTFGYSETEPLILAAGESLYACLGVANTGAVFRAEGGGYV